MITTNEWIACVDERRARGGLLAFGGWHGYTDAPGGSTPMRGRYCMVRWKAPTVAVSHEDPEEAIELAKTIERGLESHMPAEARGRPGWTAPRSAVD